MVSSDAKSSSETGAADKHSRQDPSNRLVLFGVRLPVLRGASILLALVIALTLPFFLKGFQVFQLTQVIYLSIAVLGLNILTGYNGQFSLGHSAFMAFGAYTAAILMSHMQVGYVWTIPIAGLTCFVAGFLFGLPASRLEGIYLALATFALATAVPQLLRHDDLEHWTGGVQGISLDGVESPLQFLTDDQWLYFFSLAVGALLLIAALNLVRSRFGRAMLAIRDNPIAAATMGVNIPMVKSLTFGLSGLYCGIAGALSAIVVEYVAPESYTFLHAILLLIAMVVGGVASIPGVILGAMFILYAPSFSENVVDTVFDGDPSSKALVWVAFGVFLILTVHLMPNGAAGLVKSFVRRFARPSK